MVLLLGYMDDWESGQLCKNQETEFRVQTVISTFPLGA
jgi:hypothetical protein